MCRAMDIARKVNQHTQVHQHCTIGLLAVVAQIVISNLQRVDCIALIKTRIGVILIILVDIVDVPRCSVGNRLIVAVVIHPQCIITHIIRHILGDIRLRTIGDMALCNLDNSFMTIPEQMAWFEGQYNRVVSAIE